jgi:hypothetical protein
MRVGLHIEWIASFRPNIQFWRKESGCRSCVFVHYTFTPHPALNQELSRLVASTTNLCDTYIHVTGLYNCLHRPLKICVSR